MPDESTPSTAASPSLRAQFESLILDPYRLLLLSPFLVAAGGLLLGITDVIGFSDNAKEAFEFFANDLFMTVAAVSIIVGIIAVARGVRQRNGEAPAPAPADLAQGLTNPVWLLNIAPDVILVAGAANLLFFLIAIDDIGGNIELTFAGIFDILFRVSAAFFFVVALKFISDTLHGTERTAPPVAEGAAPTWKDKYWQVVRNPDRFLLFGMFLTVYLVLLEFVFELWNFWDASAGVTWLEFFEHIAEAAGAAVFLLIARSIVSWLRGAQVTGGALGRGPGEQLAAWAERITRNPRLTINAALLLALAGGLPFYLMDIWSSRNDPVQNFWILTLEDTLFGLSIIGSLLVLRAFAMYMVDGEGSYRERLAGTDGAVFYNDPGWLLRALVYLIAALGLIYTSLTTWDWRGDGFWEVWYFFFLLGGEMLVPLAIFTGARAIYAEARVTRAREPVTLAGSSATAATSAATGTATSDSGTST